MQPNDLLRFPPEVQLVLLSAGTDGPARTERVEGLLQEPLDWGVLTLIAHREQAISRLHALLMDMGGPVPDQVRATMVQLAGISEFRMSVLEDRMDGLLGRFSSEGIPTVVLKGAALARTAYPSFSDRPMGDLDLMVQPEHADLARRVARAAGWQVAAAIDEDAFPTSDHQHLAPMQDQTGLGLGLDLHTRLSALYEPRGFTPDEIRARSRPFPIPYAARSEGGRSGSRTAGQQSDPESPMRVPDVADLLLHVCIHFAWSHVLAAGTWKAFRDVEVLAHSPDLSTEAFGDRVKDVGCEPLVFWTFRMAEEFGGVELPPSLHNSASAPVPSWLVPPLLRNFASGICEAGSGAPPASLRRWLWSLGIRPRRLGVGEIRPWSNNHKFHRVRLDQVQPLPSDSAHDDDSTPVSGRLDRMRAGLRHVSWAITGR